MFGLTIFVTTLLAALVSLAAAQTPNFDPIYAPTAGEELTAGTSFKITWVAAPAKYATEPVSLTLIGGLTQNGQQPLYTIAKSIDNSLEEFDWEIPMTYSGQPFYGIIIALVSDPTVLQYSNPFKLVAAGANTTSTSSASVATGSSTSTSTGNSTSSSVSASSLSSVTATTNTSMSLYPTTWLTTTPLLPSASPSSSHNSSYNLTSSTTTFSPIPTPVTLTPTPAPILLSPASVYTSSIVRTPLIGYTTTAATTVVSPSGPPQPFVTGAAARLAGSSMALLGLVAGVAVML